MEGFIAQLPLHVIIIGAICFTLERFFPRDKNNALFTKDTAHNFTYFIFNEYVIVTVVAFIQYQVIRDTFYKLDLPSINIFVHSSFAVKAIVGFLLFDFLQYFVHYLAHVVRPLWDIHKLHHSVLKMNFTADWRFSWMETLVFYAVSDTLLLALGFPEHLIGIFKIISLYHVTFAHCNIKFKWHFLSKLIVTPHFHLWHHAHYMHTPVSQNLGGSLTIWDKIFKTYYSPDHCPDELGFAEMKIDYPKNIFKRMFYPFLK